MPHIGRFFGGKMLKKKSNPTQVLYVTDSEGHRASFIEAINKSSIVKIKENQLVFKQENDDSHFIFGGDLADRGFGDIPLTKMLLDFKKRYPEKVHLLVGNREASKARIFIELNPKYIRHRLLEGKTPFWLQSPPHPCPVDYMQEHLEKLNLPATHMDIKNYIDCLSIEDCQLLYLKWMLEKNMGCPHTFAYHAEQLAEEYNRPISDYEVLQHFMEYTSPEGILGKYLQYTQIAAIIPNTGIIAVHGGFTPANIGRIPSMQVGDPIILNARAWVNHFNLWYTEQVHKWQTTNLETLPLELQPARSSLDCFAERIPTDFLSIVTSSSTIGKNREFISPPSEVIEFLHNNHLDIVLTGHTPCGDHPALLRSEEDKVLFIMGDTGYADFKNPRDTRGQASHCLEIFIEPDKTAIKIAATLANGEEVNTAIHRCEGLFKETLIGKLLVNNELVQCQLTEGTYRTVHQSGFKTTYQIRSVKEIQALLPEECILESANCL